MLARGRHPLRHENPQIPAPSHPPRLRSPQAPQARRTTRP
jgi:hypothetical protein